MTPSPTQSNVQAALRNFLLAVLPDGVEVVAGQPNRVPEVEGDDFVIMTPIRFMRLETNVDGDGDVRFEASIAGDTMTVTEVTFGEIAVGATVFGTGVATNTRVIAFDTGTGEDGTYTISPDQTVSSEIMSAGSKNVVQQVEWTIQLDFHSASLTSAGDMATVVSTLMRDAFATQQFAEQSPYYGVSPLYADDPRQMPWVNDQQQVEWRWVLEAKVQAPEQVVVPQQYADVVEVDVISVDATFPP